MKQYDSENYIFNYQESSYIEKNIEQIAVEQEKCFRYICSVLQMKPDFKINYFLFETPNEIAKISNDRFDTDYETLNGFAYINEIYAVYNESVKCIGFHEDAHIISFVEGYGDSIAVIEGLAMYFDRQWWGIHNLHWVNYYMKKNVFVPVNKLIEDNDFFYSISDIISYPIMGAFTEWLINTNGIEKYKRFFKDENAVAACEEIYKCTLVEMNNLFMDYVSLFSLDEGLYERMESLLGDKLPNK